MKHEELLSKLTPEEKAALLSATVAKFKTGF